MLQIMEGDHRFNRRQLLTLGSLGMAQLACPQLMQAATPAEKSYLKGKSVIYIFMQGGPSQLETFDPKPHAPQEVRTLTDVISTSLPSVQFGSALPQLAQRADRLTVVRGFQTNNAGHNVRPLVGPESMEANIGVHYAKVVGATQKQTGMPTGAVLFPQAVDDKVPKGAARGKINATGPYADSYQPFIPGAGGQLQEDMILNLPQQRLFEARQPLLKDLDRFNIETQVAAELSNLEQMQEQAFQMLLDGGVARALDLSLEDSNVLAKYDTSRYIKTKAWNHVRRGQAGYYSGQAKTIGKLLLLARRLCEAGCGFVTVHAGYQGVWDMHADGNNLNMVDGMQAVGRSFDHAVAALIDDLEARGLADKVMVVAGGEMGRTPRINKKGGRDHWSKLAPLMLYNGKQHGQVIGQSTRDGGEPTGTAYGPENLISTILHNLFDIGKLRLESGVPREVLKLAEPQPII